MRRKIITSIGSFFTFLFIIETFLRILVTKLFNFIHHVPSKKAYHVILLTSLSSVKPRFSYTLRRIVRDDFVLSPLMAKLAKKYSLSVITGDPHENLFRMMKELVRLPSNYLYYEAYLDFTIFSKIFQASRIFKKRWKFLVESSGVEEIFSFKGVRLWPYFSEFFSRQFYISILRHIRRSEALKSLLQKEKPDIFVLTNEYGDVGKLVSYQSRRMGVPTIAIQHGEFTETDPGYYQNKEEEKQFTPDYFAVMGSYFKEVLLEMNYKSEDFILVAGLPRLDLVYNDLRHFDREKFRKELGLKPEERLLVLSTQWVFPKEMKEDIKLIIDALKKHSNIRFFIKVRPGENLGFYQEILKECQEPDVFVDDNVNIYELFHACDFTITRTSTTAMESLLLEKPLILIRKDEAGFDYSVQKQFRDYKVASFVKNSSELSQVLIKLLNDLDYLEELKKYRAKFVQERFYKFDGMVSSRIFSHIEKIMKEKKS